MGKQNIEIELRAKVDRDLEPLINLPTSGESSEHDIYFKHQSKEVTGWISRIRRKGNKSFLTFKSAKSFGEGSWSEVDIEISSEKADQMHDFFLENGFEIDVEITKLRRTYIKDDLEINLDNIAKLGQFIEVQIMSESSKIEESKQIIKKFLQSLGIDNSSITTQGYVPMMRSLKNGSN